MLTALTVLWAATAAQVPPPPRPHTLLVGAGFSHWYGGTFGAPVGFSTPGLNVAMQPGVGWLEVTAAYTLSLRPLPLPNDERGLVGFATVGVSLLKEVRFDHQRLGLAGGPVAGLVHTPRGAGGAFGARLKAHYLIELSPTFAIGPAFEARAVLYALPGSNTPIYAFTGGFLQAGHSDVLIDLSVVVAVW